MGCSLYEVTHCVNDCCGCDCPPDNPSPAVCTDYAIADCVTHAIIEVCGEHCKHKAVKVRELKPADQIKGITIPHDDND